MRTPRLLSPLLVTLALSAGCSRCGSRPAPAVERFVAADTDAVLVIPSLERFARQGSDLLETARGLPFGSALLDGRSVVAGRLSFDPLDAASVAAAGLDPKRGAALFGRAGTRGAEAPDIVLSLPVGDAAKLEATFATLARERLGAPERAEEPGSPPVVAWRAATGGPIALAYAVVEQTALVSMGGAAVEAIRAAAAVPAGATLGGDASYQRSRKALGDGVAAAFYARAGSAALKEFAQFKDGVAFGLEGAKDRVALCAALPLGARAEAARAAAAGGKSGALMAKLDPAALLVVRGDGSTEAMIDPADVTASLALQGLPKAASEPMADFLAALGGSSAVAVTFAPPSGKPTSLQAEPFSAVKVEGLLSLKDPPRMTRAVQRALGELLSGAGGARGPKPDVAKAPFRLPLAGGEVGVAVDGDRLAFVVGPKGSMDGLLTRSGTTFKGPTPASDAALKAASGGLFLDVPRLAANLKALPEPSYGPGEQGVMLKSMVDQYATAAERVRALSVRSEVVDGFARGELVVEVTPPSPPAAR